VCSVGRCVSCANDELLSVDCVQLLLRMLVYNSLFCLVLTRMGMSGCLLRRVAMCIFASIRPPQCVIVNCGEMEIWFQVHEVLGPDKKILKIPIGHLCLKCGCACEVWPLLSSDEILLKIEHEISFKRDFDMVRAGVKACRRRWEIADVIKVRECGMRSVLKCAFILADLFANHLALPPASTPGAKIIKVPSPEGVGELEGVALPFDSVPPGITPFSLELYSDFHACINEQVLSSADILRSGHAADMYTWQSKDLLKSRPTQNKIEGILKLTPWSTLSQNADKVKSERKVSEQVEQERLANIDAGASVAELGGQIVSGSRLGGCSMPPPAAPTSVRKGGGRGRGGGGRGGGGAGRRGGGSSRSVAEICRCLAALRQAGRLSLR
jgi:uncharacterized membrane protein YgcG